MKNKFKLDFIGIGSERCATTWMSDCLREHPEIFLPEKKEIYFFNEFDPHLLKVKNLKYKKGISWYKTFFKNRKSGQIAGEFSPTYIYEKKTAKRIYKHFPDAKVIVIFRDPVKRAFSQYLRNKRLGIIGNISYEKALKINNSYIKKSLYSEGLNRFLNIFPKENVLIFLYDEIEKDPKKVINRLYKELGVDHKYIPNSLKKRINTAAVPKLPLINNIMIQTEYFIKRKKLEWLIDFTEKSGIRKIAFNIAHFTNEKPLKKYPEINKKTKEKLREYFRKDVEKLEKLIKKDLSSWK